MDAEACYRALVARDPRFDGVFFVGVRRIFKGSERQRRMYAHALDGDGGPTPTGKP